ncbi:MAG: hypothetical protein QOF73_808, partial [Thermomicrobiales bacterium]|nr:hypothetical protein [Thermomicrobiales bacterium]
AALNSRPSMAEETRPYSMIETGVPSGAQS